MDADPITYLAEREVHVLDLDQRHASAVDLADEGRPARRGRNLAIDHLVVDAAIDLHRGVVLGGHLEIVVGHQALEGRAAPPVADAGAAPALPFFEVAHPHDLDHFLEDRHVRPHHHEPALAAAANGGRCW